MTDRELLELAAKAAGLKEYGWMAGTLTHVVNNQFVFWNPLTDDGDALRLAVKLRLGVIQWGDSASATHAITNREYSVPYGGDQLAATRRAITRAAAAIGGLSSDPSGKGV